MKINNRHYFNAKITKASTIIELENILDFCQYIEQQSIKEIFFTSNSTKFSILDNNAILEIATNGFLNIDDAKKAGQNNFPTSTDYYTALELGYTKYEDYQLITIYGITDKTVFDEIEKYGFIDGFEKYKAYFDSIEDRDSKLPFFPNVYELFKHADQNNFVGFDNFFAAYQLGFINQDEYNSALQKNFTNAKDYNYAIVNGFPDNDNYQMALQHNLKTYSQLIQKVNLEISYPDLAHDKSVLLFLISKLEQGKKVSLNKLKSLLENALIEYQDPTTKKIDEWFKQELKTIEDIGIFLDTNPLVNKFGSYHSDGEFFEINSAKDRSIVIDGSNVAHNSKNGITSKPMIANLITMVKFLKTKGFTDILIISDASLRHKLGDKERMPELLELVKYEVAPAETTADTFLISHVKSKHCLILSNDTFKQYKITDPWTAMNIDYYRLTFMITDDVVFMPDLD